eukprot:14516715-Alexandrium_andersonii.AAC.1
MWNCVRVRAAACSLSCVPVLARRLVDCFLGRMTDRRTSELVRCLVGRSGGPQACTPCTPPLVACAASLRSWL